MPSRFLQPFRTPGGASLSPLYKSPSEPNEIDYTLLRRNPDNPARPLFQVDDTSMSTPAGAGGPPNAGTPDQFPNAPFDYNRSSYFRYQAIQRLGGAASCHSNVFAVWITVGYFQVAPAANPNLKDPYGNLVYPDGYQLGQELGSDTRRHRPPSRLLYFRPLDPRGLHSRTRYQSGQCHPRETVYRIELRA